MNNLYQIGEIQEKFKATFEECSLEYHKASFNDAAIHCFFAKIPSELILRGSWIQISNFIALEFQNKLEDEFEQWNIYLFYKMSEEIDRSLNYIIENDTFSSRKIVVNNNKTNERDVEEHILNADMIINADSIPGDNAFSYNEVIYHHIGSVKSKKKLGAEMEESLKKIIETIKTSRQ